MIVDKADSYWVWVRPSSSRDTGLEKRRRDNWWEHGGKWLIFDRYENLKELALKLDPHVEQGIIRKVKYNRKPGKSNNPVMCVYCLDSERQDVLKILEQFGVTRQNWKYDKQTLEDWKPGGRLYEK